MTCDAVFIENGIKRRGVLLSCLHCNQEFYGRVNPAKGKKTRKYCSKKCKDSHFSYLNTIMVECATCHIHFRQKISQQKKSKSGLSFCSLDCKNEQHKIGGLIAPRHYGTANGVHNYREIAEKNHGLICADCGLSFEALLAVHHIDGNKDNNTISNLIVLCHNHHIIRHMKKHQNHFQEEWRRQTNILTPLSDLDELRKKIEIGSKTG